MIEWFPCSLIPANFIPQTFMKAITTFVSGLLLSALLLLPVPIRAAELQPFFTFKASSINTLVTVAEKFASMADAADTDEFREFVSTAKSIKGFDLNGIFGFAAAVNEGGGISPILLLPITDLWRAEIPGQPEIFDALRPFLVRRGEGKFDINSPFGTFSAVQKQNYLVITPEEVADQVPAEPKKLFADVEKFTIGVKLDLEKVDFDTIESTLFGPILMIAMMNDPAVGEQFENVIEVYRELYKEIAAVSYGYIVNPPTADVELSGTVVPRKGSGVGKTFAGYKQQPTIFGGFRGMPGNTVFSLGNSVTSPPLENNAITKNNLKQLETMLEGFREQIEMEDETGEISKLAETASESILKIIETESKKEANDSAFSLTTDGTLLCAFDTNSLEEIRKLAELAVAFAGTKLTAVANDFEIDAKALVDANLRREYVTVEGFKVSSFKFPVKTLIATLEKTHGSLPADAPADVLDNMTLGVFWAVKDGNKQAIAVAAGMDFDKTEQAFKAALEKTKTSAPVQKPVGTFSIAGLGKFFQQTLYPLAGNAAGESEFAKVIDIFTAAGNDAAITLDFDIKSDRVDFGIRVPGKAIQAIISAVKLGIEVSNQFGRPVVIQDF